MATGFQPDEKKKKNSFGDAAAASGDAAVAQIPTGGTPAPAAQVIAQAQPAATAAQPLDAQAAADRAAASGFMGTLKDANQRAGAAIADVATFVPRGLAGAYDTAVVRPMRAAGIDAGYVSPLLAPAGSDPASQTPFYDKIRQQDAVVAAASPAAASAASAGRATVNPAPAAAPPVAAKPAAPVAAPADPSATTNQVTRVGNSYSGGNVAGDISINGKPAGFGGAISQQNQNAAQALSDRYQAEAVRGFQPAADPAASNPNPGLSVMGNTGGFGILDKGYQERRSAGMALGSITASREEKAASLKALENLDIRDMKAADNASAITRQGMADETTRRGQDVTAKSASAVNALTQQRIGLEGQRLGMEQTAAGFTSRAAARIESLQTAYEAAKPEDKPAIAEQLSVLTGKSKPAEWKAIALQGSTDRDGNKTEGVLAAVNERTGEARRLDQGQKAQTPTPASIDQLKANPQMATQFNQMFGAGAAEKIIGNK